MEILRGVGLATGIAIGPALVVLDEDTVVVDEPIACDFLENEERRFIEAIEKAKNQIQNIKNRVRERIGEEQAFIFDTHVILMEDRSLKQDTIRHIYENNWNAEWAFSQVLMKTLKKFSSLSDPFFADRGNDVKDIGKRILKILRGAKDFGFHHLNSDIIVIGTDFGPSNITHFENKHILGFSSDLGGRTTHTAIIARALNLPAVLGLHDISKRVKSGDMLILDSFSGKVFVNPDQKTLAKYQKMRLLYKDDRAKYLANVHTPAQSKDGKRVELLANIELPSEIDNALINGAQGIGLYRTEFLFLKSDPELPSEQMHFDIYTELAKTLKGKPLTIRTFDLGGEKFFHRTFVREKETNPVMGLRGIRLCFQRKDIFKVQLRAILRAAHEYNNIRIMFPLISGIDEWREIQDFLGEVKQELREEALLFEENPTLGIMIEVPSAAMIADYLAAEVDFFSIGTNDLLQYFLAIDRANDDVIYLYDPFHPGFVRMLGMIIDAANKANIDVNCCGEMASSPLYAFLLVQMGLRKLSMSPTAVPIVHHMVRAMDFGKLKKLVPNPSKGPTGRESQKAYLDALKHLLEDHDFQHLGDDLSSESLKN